MNVSRLFPEQNMLLWEAPQLNQNESNELQGVPWDPSQILLDGIWLIT